MASPEEGSGAQCTARSAAPGVLDRALERAFGVVEALLAALMLAMVAMVLGNVILRYVFGTGIMVSEELSRLGLVWITFAGAVVAWWRGMHLGVDNVVSLLPPVGRWVCALLSEAAALLCCALVVVGTAQQHEVSATTTSLIAGIPLIWMYGMGYVAGAGIAGLSLLRLLRLLRAGPRAVPLPAHEHKTEAVA